MHVGMHNAMHTANTRVSDCAIVFVYVFLVWWPWTLGWPFLRNMSDFFGYQLICNWAWIPNRNNKPVPQCDSRQSERANTGRNPNLQILSGWFGVLVNPHTAAVQLRRLFACFLVILGQAFLRLWFCPARCDSAQLILKSGHSEGFHIMHSYALRSPVAGITLPVSIEVTTITNNRFVLIGYTIR